MSLLIPHMKSVELYWILKCTSQPYINFYKYHSLYKHRLCKLNSALQTTLVLSIIVTVQVLELGLLATAYIHTNEIYRTLHRNRHDKTKFLTHYNRISPSSPNSNVRFAIISNRWFNPNVENFSQNHEKRNRLNMNQKLNAGNGKNSGIINNKLSARASIMKRKYIKRRRERNTDWALCQDNPL